MAERRHRATRFGRYYRITHGELTYRVPRELYNEVWQEHMLDLLEDTILSARFGNRRLTDGVPTSSGEDDD